LRKRTVLGNPAIGEIPALMRRVLPVTASSAGDAEDTNIKTDDTRYRVRIAKSEQTRDKHLEVLADHSTEVQRWIAEREGGEVKP